MPIPPDTRAPGDAGHLTDHHDISDELTTLVAADTAEASARAAADALLAPLASPALTGTPTAPTKTALTSSTALATTAYADSAVGAEASRATTAEALKAPLASPAFTGTPTGPTPSAGDSSTKLATTAFTAAAVNATAAVFSPISYGAVGNGTTDDTTALQNCAAAAAAAKGVIDLGTSTFKTTSPVNITSNFHMKGAGYNGGTIVNAASAIFTIASTATLVTFEGCNFTSNAGGGHIWDATNGPSMAFWKISGCQATQNNPAKSIWNQVGGSWIDCIVDGDCLFSCAAARVDAGCGTTNGSTTVTDTHAVSGDAGLPIGTTNLPAGTTITSVTPGTGYVVSAAATATGSSQSFFVGGATVAPWYVSGVTAFNSVMFSRMRCAGNYSTTVPFFRIDAGSASGYGQNIIFRSVTFEVCVGGSVYMAGYQQITVDQCIHWDATPLASTFSFQQSSAGFPCRGIVVRQSGAVIVTFPSVFPDISVASTCTNVLIDSCGIGGVASYSSPANQTTVINPPVSGSTVPPVSTFPGPIAIPAGAGNTGATAGGRIAGWTASGAPASGTFAAGDLVPDLTGIIWICTAGGTPGTWVRHPLLPDIQYFTANGTWNKPAGAKTVAVTMVAGGCGGGSGASGASGTVQCGGGGGAGGIVISRQFDASDLSTSETVTVGAGANGGAAVTGSSGNTSGNAGATGGSTQFGTRMIAYAGGPGGGGTTTTGTGGTSGTGLVGTSVGSGGAASAAGGTGGTGNPSVFGPPGGPAGGGITTGAVASNGGAGWKSYLSNDTTAGAAGVAAGASPTAGTASTVKGSSGPSAGGGAASTTGAAQAGADALANTGAGGAGDGASLNTFASGKGGNGGSGFVLVVSMFQ